MSSPVDYKDKGLKSEQLDSRFARATVTGGEPLDRMMGNYAKKAAKGAGPSTLSVAMVMPSAMSIGR